MGGIEHFLSFLSENRETFMQDGERQNALERYRVLTSNIPSERMFARGQDEGGWSIESIRPQEQDQEARLPQGPISMILINVDKIGEK